MRRERGYDEERRGRTMRPGGDKPATYEEPGTNRPRGVNVCTRLRASAGRPPEGRAQARGSSCPLIVAESAAGPAPLRHLHPLASGAFRQPIRLLAMDAHEHLDHAPDDEQAGPRAADLDPTSPIQAGRSESSSTSPAIRRVPAKTIEVGKKRSALSCVNCRRRKIRCK